MQISPREHAGIIKKYTPYMHSVLNPLRQNISAEDMDEIESSCQWAMIRAEENYNEMHDKGATCMTLVRHYITHVIAQYFHSKRTLKSLRASSVISLSTPIGANGNATLEDFIMSIHPESPIDEKIQLDEAIASMQNPRNRDILHRIGGGESMPSIAKEYGVCRERIRQIREAGVVEMGENVGRKRKPAEGESWNE